jgi:cytochrome P450
MVRGKSTSKGLPPGPSAPASIQTARYLFRPIQLMEACRRRFGDVFTLRLVGGPRVMVADPVSAKSILDGDREHIHSTGREQVFKPVLGPRSVFVLAGEEHRGRRRLLTTSMHAGGSGIEQGLIERIVERDLSDWPVGVPFAINPRMRAIALETILAAVFGFHPMDARAEPVRRLSAMMNTPRAYQLLGNVAKGLRLPGPHRAWARALGQVGATLTSQIEARRAAGGPESGSALSVLVAARDDDGRELDTAELRDHLLTLLLAGHLTTATGLAWCFELLLRRPAALVRLLDEIRRGQEDSYLEAVILEALRVRPVIPMVARRLGRPTELGGHQIAAGSDVGILIWLLHTRADLYPDPYEFRPERFLESPPGNAHAWLPFGGGTHRCLGAGFAVAEMKEILRLVLERMELRPASRRPERIVRSAATFAPARGARVVVEHRLG